MLQVQHSTPVVKSVMQWVCRIPRLVLYKRPLSPSGPTTSVASPPSDSRNIGEQSSLCAALPCEEHASGTKSISDRTIALNLRAALRALKEFGFGPCARTRLTILSYELRQA